MWSSILFSIVLLVVSAWMMAWHVRARRCTSRGDWDERALDFFRRQYRRRMQASAMIGLVGAAVLGGIWIKDLLYAVAYWGCVTLVVMWMGLLALADLLSTRTYYRQLRRDHLTEHAALQAELTRIRGGNGNGRPEKPPGDSSDHESL